MDAEEIKNELSRIQTEVELEIKSDNGLDSSGSCATCSVCKHPACSQMTEVFYENSKNIDSVKLWFSNKFNRSFSDNTWVKHFKDHVEPFVKSYAVVKQKKINELMETSARTKRDPNLSQVAVIKQMLFELMVDGYISKPEQIITKEDMVKFEMFSKNISNLAKSYQGYQQMEINMLGFGKTEEEYQDMMKKYMRKMMKDTIRMFADLPEAQERLSEQFGIPLEEEERVEIENAT